MRDAKLQLYNKSVHFSCSVVSDSFRPHESQHAGVPVHHHLPEFTQTCVHPAISSSGVPFSSCPQSLQASESFPMSQLFTSDDQNTGFSTLASFLPKKSQGLISFRMDWLDLLAVQGTLKSLLQQFKSISSPVLSLLHSPTLISTRLLENHSFD